jgi:hypothetical protein
MKYLIALAIGFLSTTAFAEAEIKEVCKDKKDAKGQVVRKADGTAVQECKKIKVHKKAEGTKIPDKK